jgi:hypothetical protein
VLRFVDTGAGESWVRGVVIMYSVEISARMLYQYVEARRHVVHFSERCWRRTAAMLGSRVCRARHLQGKVLGILHMTTSDPSAHAVPR